MTPLSNLQFRHYCPCPDGERGAAGRPRHQHHPLDPARHVAQRRHSAGGGGGAGSQEGGERDRGGKEGRGGRSQAQSEEGGGEEETGGQEGRRGDLAGQETDDRTGGVQGGSRNGLQDCQGRPHCGQQGRCGRGQGWDRSEGNQSELVKLRGIAS